ncbi:MAG: hypothetical protein IIX61_07855 [Loktanella sp.]|nr:hypothetical protein [Loktanella sp.]
MKMKTAALIAVIAMMPGLATAGSLDGAVSDDDVTPLPVPTAVPQMGGVSPTGVAAAAGVVAIVALLANQSTSSTPTTRN